MSHGSQTTHFPSLCSGSSPQHQYPAWPPLLPPSGEEMCLDPFINYFGEAPSPKSNMSQSVSYPDNGSGYPVPSHFSLQASRLCRPADIEGYCSLPEGERPLNWEDPSSAFKTMAASDQFLTSDLYDSFISRHGACQRQSAEDSKGGVFHLASGFGTPAAARDGSLPPYFPSSPQFRPHDQELWSMPPHFSAASSGRYSVWSQEVRRIYLQQMTSTGRKKTTRSMKNPHSVTGKHGETSEISTTSVPNKLSSYFSNRGIFMFVPLQSVPSVGPWAGMNMISIADRYILCQKALCQRLAEIDLPPKVSCVYNPLEYAFETHYKFVKKFYNSTKRVLFLGMNPGPFGMSQNGVPFGDCSTVRDWMQIEGDVQQPTVEHPKRPVKGMSCRRSEISAVRFWQLFRRLCPCPVSFFGNCAIHNLCPLTFMTETGRNLAPSDMPVKVLRQLSVLCGLTFLEVVSLFQTDHVIAVGKYAFAFAERALPADRLGHVKLHCMMHPSPANPPANKGWADIAEGQLRQFGVYDLIVSSSPPPKQQSSHPLPSDPFLVPPPPQPQLQPMQPPQHLHHKPPQQQHQSLQHFPHLHVPHEIVPETSTAHAQKSQVKCLHGSRPH